MMKEIQTMKQCEHCDCLKKNALKELNQFELHQVDTRKVCSQFKKGEIIFREGNRANGLYCISSGKVKIYKTGIEGRDQIVRMAKTGDIIGYRALLSGEPYFASASALEDTSVCMIPASDFNKYTDLNPSFSKGLLQKLTQDLKESEERMMRMAQKSVRERLAATLLLLMQTFGTVGPDKVLNVDLSREDIASLVGTATETVIRLISDFKTEQIIATRGKKILILNEKALHIIGD
jgi:CRP-like cAMP-binding protein